MKSTAKKEKAGKRRALAQVAQLQGMLQGLQMTTNNAFMPNPQIFSTPINRNMPQMMMLPTNAAFMEKISIETASEPEDF